MNASWICFIQTPEGEFAAQYTDKGLSRLDFPQPGRRLAKPSSGEIPGKIKRWHQDTCRAVLKVLKGAAPQSMPPLDLSGSTYFQRAVWRALQKIKPGLSLSYADVAACLGRPRAARAVGGACGANPIPLLIPCHRVVASGGRLGGYSGGLDWKKTLLRREGCTLAEK